MKNPVTGMEMRLEMELRALEYRGESIPVMYHYYACEDSAEQFTTRELDDLHIIQVYNGYRAKYGDILREEIDQ